MKKFKVKLRRGNGWKVKPEAEQLDGKIFNFIKGWPITEEDSSLYINEMAMIPRNKDYPQDAPIWIASGDLEAL